MGRYRVLFWFALFAISFGMISFAHAQEVEPVAATEPSAADLLKRIEVLEKTKDSKLPTVNWTGQFQADAIGFSQSRANALKYGDVTGGEAFRRARIGMIGDYGSMNYRFEFDFAQAGRPTFLDVYAGVKDVPFFGYIRGGHFFEPFSLEQVTQDRYLTFFERSLINEAFSPSRNLGIMARNTYAEGRGSLAVGLFAADSDNFGDSTGRVGFAGTARLTGLPIYDEENGRFLHLGLGYSLRQTHNGAVQFRAGPEMRIGAAANNIPFVVDTKVLAADLYQLIGFEFLGVNGPLSVQAEMTLAPVSLRSGGTPVLYGGYGEVAWLLTGEHKRYRKDNGTVDRLIPDRDFIGQEKASIGKGPGAIELAARVSFLDLNGGSIRGGRVTDLTLGANWYLNRYLRITANYIHSMPQPATGIGGVSDGFGLRLGWDF